MNNIKSGSITNRSFEQNDENRIYDWRDHLKKTWREMYVVGRFKHMFRNNVLNYEYAIREHKGNIIIDGEITGRPMGFVSSNLVKWLGIFLIVLVFMPLFNYSGTSEPIWAYLVNINWESGLNLSRFSFTHL